MYNGVFLTYSKLEVGIDTTLQNSRIHCSERQELQKQPESTFSQNQSTSDGINLMVSKDIKATL